MFKNKGAFFQVLVANLIVLLLYSLVYWLFIDGNDGQGYELLLLGMFIVCHTVVLFLGGIVLNIQKKYDYAKASFLSALLILLIGLSACASVNSILS